jgi:hypothetical protein
MKTVAEIDSKGRQVRIFYRTPTASWTHAPGERYRYWGDRHGSEHWIEMPCPCAQKVPRSGVSPQDAPGGGEGPESARATVEAVS